EQPSNGRFAAQLEIIRDAQAQGACGPYETFQSVLLDEASDTMAASDRRQLADVLARGCTPAAGSPWDPVAPVTLQPALAEAQPTPAPAPSARPAPSPAPAPALKAQGLDWLIGTWRIPGGGGDVTFRLEADGTASGYFAAVSPALAE